MSASEALVTRPTPISPITAAEVYNKVGPELQRSFQAAAGRTGMPLLELVDELADKPIGQTGKLVLEWPVVALTTGATLAIACTQIRVNLTRSLRERIADLTVGAWEFRGAVSAPSFGIGETPFAMSFSLRDFDDGPVVKRFPPLIYRQEPAQIIVNVPQQPPPVVNNIIELAAPVPERVDFERNPNGTIKAATVKPA
jgi:hypothetical protein